MRPAPFATIALLLVSTLCAQQPAAPFTLPPGDLHLGQVIEMAARYLQANFVVADPQLLEGPSLTLTEPVITDRGGCLRALTAILQTRGLGLLTLDADHDIYEIVQVNSDRGMELQLSAEVVPCQQVAADPHGKQRIATVVPLQHVSLMQMSAALRPILFAESTFGLSGSDTFLLLSGPRDQVACAMRLVQANDRPAADAATLKQLTEQVQSLRQKLAQLQARVEAAKKAGK